jgi:hypothetical protein
MEYECDLVRPELDDSNGEAWGSYGGDEVQVRWIMVEKVPAKYVNTPTLNSVCD